MTHRTLWTQLEATYPPSAADRRTADSLLRDYLPHHHLVRTPKAMLELTDGAIIAFFAALDKANMPLWSPDQAGWFADSDVCFVNVRATGTKREHGHFIHAAKMLPAIRAQAIHLAPFLDYDFNVIYAPRSMECVSPAVVSTKYSQLGGIQQLQAFIQAAKLLGKAVGFDLLPHVAQFAVTVLENPTYFRWIKLAGDKRALFGGLSMNQMLTEAMQIQIASEITQIVSEAKRRAKIETLDIADPLDRNFKRVRKAYSDLVHEVIARGYWTVVSQSWAADGVPSFAGYNFEKNYARFEYRGRHGEDVSSTAYHVVTPFKFYTGMRGNQPPQSAEIFAPATAYFANLINVWRDQHGCAFDFIRYDSVDHVFDSITSDGLPVSDRPTPSTLEAAIRASKVENHPYTANFAERMGEEAEAYASIGFDGILGIDMLRHMDSNALQSGFYLHDRLVRLNAERETPFAVSYAVDTHDTGNPHFWGKSVIEKDGPDGLRLRHFLSRFLGNGKSKRPKYEVMGAQDLSYGLYPSNIREINLTWVGNEGYNVGYHFLEDTYRHYRDTLMRGELCGHAVTSEYAWWMVYDGQTLLVAVIAFQDYPPIYMTLVGHPPFAMTEYDFRRSMIHTWHQESADFHLTMPHKHTARLLVVRSA